MDGSGGGPPKPSAPNPGGGPPKPATAKPRARVRAKAKAKEPGSAPPSSSPGNSPSAPRARAVARPKAAPAPAPAPEQVPEQVPEPSPTTAPAEEGVPMEPSQAHMDEYLAITGADQSIARSHLLQAGGDVEAAIALFFSTSANNNDSSDFSDDEDPTMQEEASAVPAVPAAAAVPPPEPQLTPEPEPDAQPVEPTSSPAAPEAALSYAAPEPEADSASDVQSWLAARGLARYAKALADEGFVDTADLEAMAPADLEILCKEVSQELSADEAKAQWDENHQRQMFARADKDGSGTISGAEFATMAAELGHELTDQALTEAIAEIRAVDPSVGGGEGEGGADNQGISFEQFRAWWVATEASRAAAAAASAEVAAAEVVPGADESAGAAALTAMASAAKLGSMAVLQKAKEAAELAKDAAKDGVAMTTAAATRVGGSSADNPYDIGSDDGDGSGTSEGGERMGQLSNLAARTGKAAAGASRKGLAKAAEGTAKAAEASRKRATEAAEVSRKAMQEAKDLAVASGVLLVSGKRHDGHVMPPLLHMAWSVSSVSSTRCTVSSRCMWRCSGTETAGGGGGSSAMVYGTVQLEYAPSYDAAVAAKETDRVLVLQSEPGAEWWTVRVLRTNATGYMPASFVMLDSTLVETQKPPNTIGEVLAQFQSSEPADGADAPPPERTTERMAERILELEIEVAELRVLNHARLEKEERKRRREAAAARRKAQKEANEREAKAAVAKLHADEAARLMSGLHEEEEEEEEDQAGEEQDETAGERSRSPVSRLQARMGVVRADFYEDSSEWDANKGCIVVDAGQAVRWLGTHDKTYVKVGLPDGSAEGLVPARCVLATFAGGTGSWDQNAETTAQDATVTEESLTSAADTITDTISDTSAAAGGGGGEESGSGKGGGGRFSGGKGFMDKARRRAEKAGEYHPLTLFLQSMSSLFLRVCH